VDCQTSVHLATASTVCSRKQSAGMSKTLATLFVILLPVAILGMREEAQLSSKQKGNRTWEKKTYEFCLGDTQEIECPGEDQAMTIISAFYNRNRKMKKTECGTYESNRESCTPDETEALKYQCEGTKTCHLLPEDHIHCLDRPFWKLRLVIGCAVGEARQEPDRQQTARPEPVQCGDEENPCTKKDVEEDALENLELERESSGKLKPIHEAMHMFDKYLNENNFYQLGEPSQVSEPLTSTTEAPVHIMNVMAQKAVKAKVVKEVDNPSLVALSFVPCFRWSRYEKLANGEVFGDWYHWELLARLTNCDLNEGCFQLSFDDGKVYTGYENRPEPRDLIQGRLATGQDSLWVTWQGTGLLRNDFNTWGVCLPKTSTLQYAMELWEHLKTGGTGSVDIA